MNYIIKTDKITLCFLICGKINNAFPRCAKVNLSLNLYIFLFWLIVNREL